MFMKRFPRIMTVAICALVTVSCGLTQSGPADIVKKFHKAVEQGELDDALKYLSPSLTAMFPPQKIKTMLGEETKKTKAKKGISSLDITKEDVTGEVADLQITVKYGDGTTRSEDTHLTKENGEWKISPKK